MSQLFKNNMGKVQAMTPAKKEPLEIVASWFPNKLMENIGQPLNGIVLRVDESLAKPDPSPGTAKVHKVWDALLIEKENEKWNPFYNAKSPEQPEKAE